MKLSDISDLSAHRRINKLIERLDKGGDGPYDSGMEARVASLEIHIGHIVEDVRVLKSDVSSLKEDVATLKADVRHLPSKGFIVGVVLAALAVISALIIFQGQVQEVAGIPVPRPKP